MEKLQLILTDCEELVSWELELEGRLKGKTFLIEEQRKLLQITDVNENERKIVEKHEKTDQEQIKEVENLKQQNLTLQLELAKNQGIIDTQKEEIQHLRSRPITPLPENQPSESLVNQIIIKLNQKQLSTSETQEILNQTKDYLGAKRIFLNTRQITIRGLQNCYNKLKGSKKYDKADEVGKIISAGGTVASSLTFGVPKAFGDTISTINSSFKKKFSDKREREFQELLVNDKENLFLLNNDLVGKVYSSLINNQHLDLKDCLESKEIELFSSKYKVFEIDSSIWEDKPLSTAEEMEKVIVLLSENYDKLETRLKKEEKQFKEFSIRLEQENQTLQILQPTTLPFDPNK